MAAETANTRRLAATRRPTTDAPALSGTRCKAVKADGSKCQSTVLSEAGFCFWHDPACHDKVIAAGRKGNAAGRLRRVVAASTPTIELRTAEDVRRCISDTVDKLSRGEIDRGIANGVVYGCQVALRAIDVAELERRIGALEAARKPKGRGK